MHGFEGKRNRWSLLSGRDKKVKGYETNDRNTVVNDEDGEVEDFQSA